MKNPKTNFQKLKFLIPLFVGSLLAYLLKDTQLNNVGFMFCVFFISAGASIHQWRMVYDEKYFNRKMKFFEEQKRKPWHRRVKFYRLEAATITLSVMFLFAAIGLVLNFFYIGLSLGDWNVVKLIFAFGFFILFVIGYKICNMK